MNTEQQKETNRIIVCGVLGIIAMVYLALIGCVNVQHFNYKMNSDIGAEAVLCKADMEQRRNGSVYMDFFYGNANHSNSTAGCIILWLDR